MLWLHRCTHILRTQPTHAPQTISVLQVRAAYLQLEKEPSEPRISELFYVAYQKMVDRAKAAERAEAQAAGRKLGEKPSKAELARTWRKRKLKPPGTLKRVV